MNEIKLPRPTHIANWDTCPRLFRYRKDGWTPRTITKDGIKPLIGAAAAFGMEAWHKTHHLDKAVTYGKLYFNKVVHHYTNHGCSFNLPNGYSYYRDLVKTAIRLGTTCELFNDWTNINAEVFVDGVEGARVDILGQDRWGVWSIADYKVTMPYKPLTSYDVDKRFDSYLYGHQSGLYTACNFKVKVDDTERVVLPERFYIVLIELPNTIYWRYREISPEDRENWLRSARVKVTRMNEDETTPIRSLPMNEYHTDPFGRPCEMFEGCIRRNGLEDSWHDIMVKVPWFELTYDQLPETGRTGSDIDEYSNISEYVRMTVPSTDHLRALYDGHTHRRGSRQ